MDFYKALIGFSLTNYLVLSALTLVPGRYIAFGNAAASPQKALVVTALLIGLAVSLVGKAAEVYKLNYSKSVWMVVYLLVNVATLYVLARTSVSEIVGVGVTAYWTAVVVGFVLNTAQYVTWMTFFDKSKKKK